MGQPTIHIQEPVLADQSSASFLDDQRPHHQSISHHDVASEQDESDVTAEMAAESTILNDVRNIAQWFLAGGHAQTAPEIRSSNEVEAEYHQHQDDLYRRRRAQNEVIVNANATRLFGSFLSPAPVLSSMRKSSIDANTQPSTRYHGNNSNSFATSSQTSWSLVDESGFTNQPDLSWSSMMKVDTPTFSQSSFYLPQSEPSGPIPSPLSDYAYAGPSSSQMPQTGGSTSESGWPQFLSDEFGD